MNLDFSRSSLNGTAEERAFRCSLHLNASASWQKYFHEVHFGNNHFTIRCLFSELIPTAVTIVFNSYIIYHVVHSHCRLHRTKSRTPRQEQTRTTSWTNIVLILHSTLFLASLLSHISGHFTGLEAHEIWWVSLTILINCSLNFYVYCLSGRAFRNEICRLFRRAKMFFCRRSPQFSSE